MHFRPIDRRVFLRGSAAASSTLPFAAVRAEARETDLIARKIFFDNSDCYNVRVSPDGKNLAWAAPVDKVINLFVAPVADPAAARPVTRIAGRSISTYFRWAHTNRHLVYFSDRDGDENYRGFSVDLDSEAVTPLTPDGGVKAILQEVSHKFPQDMLFRHNQRDNAISTFSGSMSSPAGASWCSRIRTLGDFFTDTDLQLRFAARLTGGHERMVRAAGRRDLAPFIQIPIGDVDSTHLVDLSADGKTLYLIDLRGRDKAALFAMDMATRKPRCSPPMTNPISCRPRSTSERHPIAARAIPGPRPLVCRSTQVRSRTSRSRPHGPATSSSSATVSIAGSPAILRARRRKLRIRAVRSRRREVRKLFLERKEPAAMPLRKLQPVIIPARDGLRLNGYLTYPPEARQRPGAAGAGDPRRALCRATSGASIRPISGSPIAAMPCWRELSRLDRLRQGVHQGRQREWGGRMHDDLIDAVDWAIAQGIADPKRVGFFGGSYGGYSALTAATKTPDVFACIVDLFGISNLITFMETIPPYWGPWFSVWKNRLGDPDTEEGRAFLTERSPLTHIDRVVRPILIAQGMNDVRVVPAESEQMVTALKAARRARHLHHLLR